MSMLYIYDKRISDLEQIFWQYFGKEKNEN